MKLSNATAVLASAFICSAAANAQAQATLTVAVYGGVGEKAMSECVIDPFAKRTGTRVVIDPGTSGVTLNKLTQQKDRPVIDVAWMDGGVSEQAWKSDTVEVLDPARIPNMTNLLDQSRYQDEGKIYAASTGYYSMVLLYNTEIVKTPPTSWKDLWKEEYQGIVALPSAQNAMGIPIFVHLAEIFNGSIENMKPAVEKLQKLDVAAYWDSSGTATNMFQSEEIGVSPHFSTSAWNLVEGGLPLAVSIPTDGAVANDIRVHLVKNTPRRELAEQLIDSVFTKETAVCLAKAFNAGPYVKGVKLESEVAQRMPWGAEGSIDDLAIPDWLAINKNRERLAQLWNSEVARR